MGMRPREHAVSSRLLQLDTNVRFGVRNVCSSSHWGHSSHKSAGLAVWSAESADPPRDCAVIRPMLTSPRAQGLTRLASVVLRRAVIYKVVWLVGRRARAVVK